MDKKSVVYTRVSTGEQADKGVSLDNQESRCIEWAFRNNVLVSRVFREEGVSAKTQNRPELIKMLDFIRQNGKELDFLIIYDVDRLSRQASDYYDILETLKTYSIELRDPSSTLEGGKSDKHIRGIKAILAEMDNEDKALRVTENMRRRAKAGQRMHKAPYGLKNIRDELGNSSIAPIEGVSDNIAYLLIEFSKGIYTKRDILLKSKALGMTQSNGKEFSYQMIDKLLRQPLYAGLERNSLTDNELVQSIFTGIIPEAVFYKNQEILSDKKSSQRKGYKRLHPEYPLKNWVHCEVCLTPLRGSASTGHSGKRYPKYHCSTCKKASIEPKSLESKFIAMLHELTPSKEIAKLIRSIVIRVWKDEVMTMRNQERSIRKKIEVIEDQKVRVIENVIEGNLTSSDKKAWDKKSNASLTLYKRELESLVEQIGTDEETIDYSLEFMANTPKLWQDASPEMKLKLQEIIFPKGLQYSFAEGKFGTPEISPLFRLAGNKKDPALGKESLMVTHVDQTWNQVVTGLERIDSAVEESLKSEEQ